jgi:hypothetical protein
MDCSQQLLQDNLGAQCGIRSLCRMPLQPPQSYIIHKDVSSSEHAAAPGGQPEKVSMNQHVSFLARLLHVVPVNSSPQYLCLRTKWKGTDT